MRDSIIIGGGPAGASCALWLKQLGHDPLLIDSRKSLGGMQIDSPFSNGWIATSPVQSGHEIADAIHRNIMSAGVGCRLGTAVTAVTQTDEGFAIDTEDGEAIMGQSVVLATGVKAANGGFKAEKDFLIGAGRQIAEYDFSGKRVAILGGGDNAFENCLFMRGKGALSAKIFCRQIRARSEFTEQVPQSDVHLGDYQVDPQAKTVNGDRFDTIAVFYGFQVVLPHDLTPEPQRDGNGYIATDIDCETSVRGLFAVGEMAARAHPSVVTAMADGVVAAKAIQRRLEGDSGVKYQPWQPAHWPE